MEIQYFFKKENASKAKAVSHEKKMMRPFHLNPYKNILKKSGFRSSLIKKSFIRYVEIDLTSLYVINFNYFLKGNIRMPVSGSAFFSLNAYCILRTIVCAGKTFCAVFSNYNFFFDFNIVDRTDLLTD